MGRSFSDGNPLNPGGSNVTPSMRENQDWGWAYQILPFIEADTLWQQVGSSSDGAIAAVAHRIYTCPSRRNPTVFNTTEYGPRGMIDYAGNAGPFALWATNGGHANGPYEFCDYQPGLDPVLWPKHDPKWGMFTKMRHFTAGAPYNPGLVIGTNNPYIVDRQLRLSDAIDGTSHVVLIAEKRVPISGVGAPQPGDVIGYTCGFELDTLRCVGQDPGTPMPHRGPASDRTVSIPIAIEAYSFGSAHPSGFNALFVDGSVRHLRFDLDRVRITTPHGFESLFQRICDRCDGAAIDWSQVE
jgi:prepilin-type processing-associated H-X9-DG protein